MSSNNIMGKVMIENRLTIASSIRIYFHKNDKAFVIHLANVILTQYRIKINYRIR